MKLNDKGYAITLIVFGILIVFIVVLSTLLITMNNSVKLNKTVKESVVENIQLSADTSGTSLTERIEQLESNYNSIEQKVINTIYPVGSIYLSMNEEDLSTKFGGEWELIETGRTLLSAGTSIDESGNTTHYEVNTKGGSNYITINESNLPSHSHSYTPSGSVSSTFTGSQVSTTETDTNHTHWIPPLTGTATGGNHSHQNGSRVQWYNGDNPGIPTSWSPDGNNLAVDREIIWTSWSGDLTLSVKTNDTSTSWMIQNWSHAHSVTANGTVSSTFTGTASNTGSVGSGTSFSVQNPYITVYMYKRIN